MLKIYFRRKNKNFQKINFLNKKIFVFNHLKFTNKPIKSNTLRNSFFPLIVSTFPQQTPYL